MSDCSDGHCVTCSDEGVPMCVEREADGLAVCRDDGDVLHEVQIDLVSPVAAGDSLLVHAGVAIARLERVA